MSGLLEWRGKIVLQRTQKKMEGLMDEQKVYKFYFYF